VIDQRAVLFTMFGMLLVTYLPRVLPVWFFSERPLPPLVVTWLRYVPVAVLSAMLLPSLLLVEERVSIAPDNLFLWAAIPTFLIAWKTRSLFAAVLVGMVLVAGVRFVIGIG
jgi:branched-subunit amino acid transport protein